MKKCLIIMMLFSMGLAGTASAERGKFKYYRWNVTASSLQEYQRNLSLTPAPNNTYTVQTGFSFPSSNTVATAYVETPTWAQGDNYLARFDGWLLPPITGKYTFWVASDDHSELRLSTDENPANAVRLCGRNGSAGQRNWTVNADQKSAEVTLEAGKAYFFYVIWRDGTGGDGCSLGWSLPGCGGGPGAIPRWYVTEELGSVIRDVSWYPGAIEAEVWNVGGVNGNLQDISTLGPAAGFLNIPSFTTDYRTFSYNYTFRQRSIIQVPEDGLLAFLLGTDDGSRLYIGDWWTPGAELTQVVENDGGHGTTTVRSGSIPVKAGLVGITLHHYQGTGGDGIQVYYYSDTLPYQQIPVSALLSRTYAAAYNPAMEATNVAPNAVLSWAKPVFKETANNRVYLAEAGQPLAMVYEGTANSFAPTMQTNKTYYWRVDVTEPNTAGPNPIISKGPTYSFKTGTGITITTQPLPIAFDTLGGKAQFTIAATSSVPLTYQWYKDGVLLDGKTATDLTIDPVQVGDLGGYSCVVSNGNVAEDKTSATAMLALKQQVAYYPFDGTADDASGNGHNGTIVTTNVDPSKLPGFIPGVKGQAIQFNGIDQYVNAGTWNPSADSGQITISMWARWEPTGTTTGDRWQGVIGKRQAWNATDSCWQIEMSFDGYNGNPNYPNIGGLAQNAMGTGTARFLDWNYLGLERTVGGTTTASGQNLPNEGVAMAFDNNGTTKWLVAAATAWIAYDFKDEDAYTITFYTLTTGNDSQNRDPKSWTLQGSNDGGATWTVVDTRTGITLGGNRRATYKYDVATPGSYKMYKLNITEKYGSDTNIQLTELQLFEPYTDPSQTWRWHHVAATYDGVTSRLFIDGRQAASSTGFRFGPKTDAQISIGGGELHADGSYGNRFMGSIDDVRIYNYGLSNMQVAQLYSSDSGTSFCAVIPQYDFDGNCITDVADLILFMSQWLSCNELGSGACD